MADNYLERRMEELHSPRARVVSSSVQKRAVPWVLPPLKVVVVNGCRADGIAVVKHFAGAGVRVAVIDVDKNKGKELASAFGIRYEEAASRNGASISAGLVATLKAWRDADLFICFDCDEYIADIVAAVSDYRKVYPRVSSYASRVQLVVRGGGESAFGSDAMQVQRVEAGDDTSADALARMLLFLALPENGELRSVRV